MTPSTTGPPPKSVLGAYPEPFERIVWEPLGNAGGFSGARLWKGVDADGQAFCLRAWRTGRMTHEWLRFIHALMNIARFGRGLAFVPALEITRDSATWIEAEGRLWEVTNWLPGQANFRNDPSDVRLIEAVRALAQLHNVWSRIDVAGAPCPAVERRLQALADWQELLSTGWRPMIGFARSDSVIGRIAEQCWRLLPQWIQRSQTDLLRWRDVPVPLQPCLCDVWHDHILYEADTVTGVIDYGEVKVDCVAVDLARMLGSMIPDEPDRVAGALFMYNQVRPLFRGADELVALLDATGTVVGAMNWLRWIYHEQREYADWIAVAYRLELLVRRMEMF